MNRSRERNAPLLRRHETDRVAIASARPSARCDARNPPSASEIVIDHVRNPVHVNPARGDIRGDEHRTSPDLNSLSAADAGLRAIRVQRRGADLAASSRPRDAIRPMLVRAKISTESSAASRSRCIRSAGFKLDDTSYTSCVTSPRDSRGVRSARSRRVLKLMRERLDFFESDAENISVCRFFGRPHDPADLREEAHIEHAVGFIEDQELDAEKLPCRCPIRSSSRPGVAITGPRPSGAPRSATLSHPPNTVAIRNGRYSRRRAHSPRSAPPVPASARPPRTRPRRGPDRASWRASKESAARTPRLSRAGLRDADQIMSAGFAESLPSGSASVRYNRRPGQL